MHCIIGIERPDICNAAALAPSLLQIAMWVAVFVLIVCGSTAIGLAASQGAKKGGSSASGSTSVTQQADAAVQTGVPAATEDAPPETPPEAATVDPAPAPMPSTPPDANSAVRTGGAGGAVPRRLYFLSEDHSMACERPPIHMNQQQPV